jgi:hypothetical protein
MRDNPLQNIGLATVPEQPLSAPEDDKLRIAEGHVLLAVSSKLPINQRRGEQVFRDLGYFNLLTKTAEISFAVLDVKGSAFQIACLVIRGGTPYQHSEDTRRLLGYQGNMLT